MGTGVAKTARTSRGPILNYSTTVPVAQTVGEVTAILARAGAARVSTTYNAGEVIGVTFELHTPIGKFIYELPILAEPVLRVLREKDRAGQLAAGVSGKLSRATMTTQAHAERVAWRIAKDWLEAQLALIEAGLASLDQVMLPYLIADDEGHTLYQRFTERQLALGAGE